MQRMAHGWDSHFGNFPPVSTDQTTLTRTSESEHLENFLEHNDFTHTVASHEAAATNTNFNTSYYLNSSIGNTSSDCVYQKYYRETPCQADGEQMEKDFLPSCGNNNISGTDGLSGSFPSSFATDLPGLKQDCGVLATSLLNDYSDVSNCPDADVSDTRPSCKFMPNESVSKSKTDGSKQRILSEWPCSHTDNVFPSESLYPKMSGPDAEFPRPSQMQAVENIVQCSQEKVESPEKTVASCSGNDQPSTFSNMLIIKENETVEDSNNSDSCKNQKQEEEHQEVNEDTAASSNVLISIKNEPDNLDEELKSKMKESFNNKIEEFTNRNFTDSKGTVTTQDKQDKTEVVEMERKEKTSSEIETSDVQKTLNLISTDSTNENVQIDYKDKEEEIKLNTFQCSDQPGIHVSDTADGIHESKSTIQSSNHDFECFSQLAEHPSLKCETQDSVFGSPTVMSGGHLSDSNDKKVECLSTNKNTCLGKDWTCTEERAGTTSSPVQNCVSGFSNDSVAGHPESYLQAETSSREINQCLHKELTDPAERLETTTSKNLLCSHQAMTSDIKDQNVSSTSESCLHPKASDNLQEQCASPVDKINSPSSPDQQQSLNYSLVTQITQSLDENGRVSFEDLDTTEDPSVLGILYGEPLSRDDSSSDTDETKLFAVRQNEISVNKPDRDSMDHSGQPLQLTSPGQMRKNLQPVVILVPLESNGMNDLYHCGNCQHTSSNINDLIEHHHGCHSIPSFQFCKASNLYLVRTEQAENNLCDATKENQRLSSDSIPDRRGHHSKYRCTKCKLKFSKRVHYIRHMRTHTGKTPFQCPECGLYFAQTASLQRHRRMPGRCRRAKLRFTSYHAVTSKNTSPQKDCAQDRPFANLRQCYVKLVDISKTNVCNICAKCFLTQQKAKKHYYNLHRGKSSPVSSNQDNIKLGGEKAQNEENEGREKYKCPLCPRLFKYSFNRNRHLRDCVQISVLGNKGKVGNKYRCPLCFTDFTLPTNRYRHIKSICLRECLNRLSQERAKLRQNIDQKTQSMEKRDKSHSKENEQKAQERTVPRYKCNYCPAIFCYASGKYRHMKKHELFKLTGKMFRYRNSVFSTMSAHLSDTKTDKRNNHLKPAEGIDTLSLCCRFCGKYFDTSKSLKMHERNHKGERPYRCLECGKGFKKHCHLIGHKIVHQKRIQCTVCKKILPTIGELIQHRSSHLKKGMLQCPDCNLQFQFPVYLRRHMKTHKNRENKLAQLEKRPLLKPQLSLEFVKDASGSEQLQCSLCKEMFDDAQVLRKHCLTHISGSSSNQCPYCKKNFTNRRNLVRHMVRHTGDRPFTCTNCGKQFFRDYYFKLHRKSCLPAQTSLPVTVKSDTPPERPFKCSYCPRTFSKKIRLKHHHQGHKKNSVLLCTRCGQYYGFRKLNQHQRMCQGQMNTGSPDGDLSKRTSRINQSAHNMTLQSRATKKLQLKCPHCPQRFQYSSLLMRHLVSHTGVQPYACMHCGQRFRSQTMCLQHEAFCNGVYKEGLPNVTRDAALKEPALKQAESESEYKCKFCTKTFMKSRNLRRHILTHNEVKPYRCKACDSCFSRYDHLKVHQARCKGKRRLEVCIPKISLDDVGKGWQNKFNIEPAKKQETFNCSVCTRSFSTQSKLSRHVTVFHVAKLFKCTGCGSSFSHEKTLKKHWKLKKCRKVCTATMTSQHLESTEPKENVKDSLHGVKKQILQRMKPCLNKRFKYMCSYCPRTFRNKWQVSVHTRLHTGDKPFACEYCGEKFIRRDYLKRHFIKCTKKDHQIKQLCDGCGGFFFKPELEDHKANCFVKPSISKAAQSTSQSSPKVFSCAYCSSRFLLFSQLQEHFSNAHMLETVVPPRSTASLQQHLSSIPNITEEPFGEMYDQRPSDGANVICNLDKALDRDFVCPECNMSFANKAGLSGHLRLHRDQPYNCKKCKKGFWNKNHLRNHHKKCILGRIQERNAEQQLEVPLKAQIDVTLDESVLVFQKGSAATGSGVLQTNFSCKDEPMEKPLNNSEGKQIQSNSSEEKKVVQYQCSECDKSFTDGLLLINHLEDHGREEQEKKRKTCPKCGRVCTSQMSLEKHMKVHGNQKFSCPECPKVFYKLSNLEFHRASHDSNRAYACKLCHLRFCTRASLNNHYGDHHPADAFMCRFCDKTYLVKKSLSRHYREQHRKEQKALRSSVQAKSGTEQASSDQVRTTNESGDDGNNDSETSDSDSAPYFPCHVCGKTFATSESLEDHQRCHLGEKPHECGECGKCFSKASQLQQHQRMHNSEFQCQACGRGFVSLFALRKHKHTHGKSRPYRCPKCHFSFTGPSQLAEHMTTHREENFPCDICNQMFSSKSSRAEHRKSHSKPDDQTPPSVLRSEHAKSPIPSESSTVSPHKLKYCCGVCNERFKDPAEMSEHGCMSAKERPYSCSDCNKHFLHASHLEKHRITHQLSRSITEYPCNQCNSNLSSLQDFFSHLKTHVDQSAVIKHSTDGYKSLHSFVCPVCQQSFGSATEITAHVRTHLDGTFECKFCKITFASRLKLLEHERCHLTLPTQYECAVCDQRFSENDSFRQHHCSPQQHAKMNAKYSKPSAKVFPPTNCETTGDEEEIDVTGEDLYNCPCCSKQFSSKSNLLEHQNKQHRNDMPFQCELCGKKFAMRQQLKEHERRHQLPKIQCTHCRANFSTPEDLSVHMRLHAEKAVGKYRCDMCYKSFRKLFLLKQHQESHVGEVVYECTECDKAFAFPHLLEQHQQTHASFSQ